MDVVTPTWFNQRQAKAEAHGENALRLTAPNLKPAFVRTRKTDHDRWVGVLQLDENGPEVAASGADFDRQVDAWEAAFELYRQHVVV
jgi:hypothetical protein